MCRLGTALVLVLCGAALPAQEVIAEVEHMAFDEPESWGLKFFTATSLFSGVGATALPAPGRVEVGFEALSVPHLDVRQRTIGFDGEKEEDLNRAPAWGRVRVRVGLPAGFALSLGATPPITVDGVKAELLALAFDKRLHQGERVRFGLRLHAQVGDAHGDLTCNQDDAAQPPGSPGNPYGCEARSRDTVSLDYQALEANVTFLPGAAGSKRPEWHLALSAAHMNGVFQVDAPRFGFIDRTRLLTDGWIYAVAGGATVALAARLEVSGEVFYAPLEVRRPPALEEENDGLLNLRLLVRYRVR